MSTEYGWVIEHIDSEPSKPLYFAGMHPIPPDYKSEVIAMWNEDHLEAIRFSRMQDAAKVSIGLKRGEQYGHHRVAEHGWG